MPNLEQIWDESSYLVGTRNFLPQMTATYRLGIVEDQNALDQLSGDGAPSMEDFPDLGHETPLKWETIREMSTTEELLGLLSVKFDDGYRRGWKMTDRASNDGIAGSELIWYDTWPAQRVEAVIKSDPATGKLSETKTTYVQHHGGGLYYVTRNGDAMSAVQLATEHTPPEAFKNALLQGLHRFFLGTCYVSSDSNVIGQDDEVSIAPISVTSPE